jgi:lysophospholipase L1-like esterase
MTQANDEPTRPQRRFRMRSKLLLASLAGVLAFGIAEIGLRLVGFSFPQPYFPDEHCGSRLVPGFRGWWSKEGAAQIEVNSLGFRDREHELRKPKGTIRIAVLGDSYIEAFQVPQPAMFGSVLEQALNAKAADAGVEQSFEVLSFGVSGYSTAQELLALRHHVWQFEPDIVLLAFLPSNDIRGNSRELEPQQVRPFIDIVDGQLVTDVSFRKHPAFLYAKKPSTMLKRDIVNASRVIQLIQKFRSRDEQSDAGKADTEQVADRAEIGLDDHCFVEPTDSTWQSAWQVTEGLLEHFHREVAERGCQFAVAVVTAGLQVDPDPAVRRAYAKRLGVEDLGYADRRIAELGERVGFPTIPLSEPLGDFAERTGRFVHGFPNTGPGQGHWNEDGHREAALACTAALLQLAVTRSEPKPR